MPEIRTTEERPSTLRRLHAISGVFPLGAFLVQHLVLQGAALGGQARYDRATGVTSESALTQAFEAIFVFVPLAYHALYGLGLALRRRPSAARSASSRATLAMRVSGVVTLVFVLGHLFEYRLAEAFFGLAPSSIFTRLTMRMSSTSAGVSWIALGYVAGIAATTFHFAFGLSSVREVLGYPESTESRRRALRLSLLLGGAMFALGTATVIGLATGSRLLPDADPGMTAPCGSAVTPAPSGAPSSR